MELADGLSTPTSAVAGGTATAAARPSFEENLKPNRLSRSAKLEFSLSWKSVHMAPSFRVKEGYRSKTTICFPSGDVCRLGDASNVTEAIERAICVSRRNPPAGRSPAVPSVRSSLRSPGISRRTWRVRYPVGSDFPPQCWFQPSASTIPPRHLLDVVRAARGTLTDWPVAAIRLRAPWRCSVPPPPPEDDEGSVDEGSPD